MTPRSRTKSKPAQNGQWAGTLAEWKARAGPHHVTLPSGMQVVIRILGLGELMMEDAIPEHLSDLVALHLLNRDQGGIDAVMASELVESQRSPEAAEAFQKRLREAAELTKRIVCQALVQPKVTYEELEESIGTSALPWEDLEELFRLSTGQKAFDSKGVRIGVEPLSSAARFHHHHGIELDPELGVEACEACQAWLGELSSLHVGAV